MIGESTLTNETMSITQDVHKGIFVNSLIRVALCPVGNINAATFKKFAVRIQAFSSIPITHLTRFQQDNLKSIHRLYLQ